ncbi:MAG TPA: hypothetical protein ENI93_05275 [Gammaproteobacteria bacterium]|nr:hypothetical protein [Gammaproteobacteria bacterium]
MPAHEEKLCPRCRRAFECKSGSILLCQCQTVVLDEAQLAWIAERYDDCLCSRCLREVRSECNRHRHQQRLRRFLQP